MSEAEYENWLEQQSSYYMTNIRNTDADPFKGKLLSVEAEQRAEELASEIESAIGSQDYVSSIRLDKCIFSKQVLPCLKMIRNTS